MTSPLIRIESHPQSAKQLIGINEVFHDPRSLTVGAE